jgi:hypothetical protein
MNILHIGCNDGSHLRNTVVCLREAGYKAQGLTFYHSNIINYENVIVFKKWQFIFYYLRFVIEALRADIVHLWSVQVPGIVWFLKLINKPFVVEWTGQDIRNPELMPAGYKTDYAESKEQAFKNQFPFKNYVNISSSHILINHLINPFTKYIPHRICLNEYTFNPTSHKPLKVIHCSSNRSAKGTDTVLKEVEGMDIDFKLVEKTNFNDCKKEIANCDVMIGQMYWGENGMNEVEAMASGKPVLCYISHDKQAGMIHCRPEEIRKRLDMFSKGECLINYFAKRQREFLELLKPLQTLIEVYEGVLNG